MTTYLDIKSQFPVLNRPHADGKPLVYLDTAATAQKPVAVIDAMDRFYRESYGTVRRGVYRLSEKATAAYEGTREKAAKLLNAASPKEIVYTRGTTDGLNLVAASYGGSVVVVEPAERLRPAPIAVPADISSAAFFVVAALLVPGSEVVLEGVGVNPTRTGLLGILARMGAEVELEPGPEAGGEPTARLRVRPGTLRGVEVGGAEVPLAIDELPLVALAACFAEGTTTIADAAELRRKESDRIATVCAALTALGGRVEPTADGMVVEGAGGLRGGAIDSHGDHRIAMLGAVAGLASREGVEVRGMDAAAVSYPGFAADLASLLAR